MSTEAHKLPVVAPTVYTAEILRAPAEMSDAELGAAAAQAVERHLAARADSIEAAIRAGELLREARRRCEDARTSWAAWLQRHWPKSRQTAQRYMALALEVSQISGPRAGGNLLGLPSVRAALTEVGYDAGSLREPGADEGEEDRTDEEKDATDEAVRERLLSGPPPLSSPRPHVSPRDAARVATERAEKAKRENEERERTAEDQARIKAERLADLEAIDRAEKNDPIANPPKMEIPKRKPAEGEDLVVPTRRAPTPRKGPVTPIWLSVSEEIKASLTKFTDAMPAPRTDVKVDPIKVAYIEAHALIKGFVTTFCKLVEGAAAAESDMERGK